MVEVFVSRYAMSASRHHTEFVHDSNLDPVKDKLLKIIIKLLPLMGVDDIPIRI